MAKGSLGNLNGKNTDRNSRITTPQGRLFAKHVVRNQHAISALKSPTYYSNRINIHPDMLDTLLHHMGLPGVDVQVQFIIKRLPPSTECVDIIVRLREKGV